jgi:hypothetical protein
VASVLVYSVECSLFVPSSGRFMAGWLVLSFCRRAGCSRATAAAGGSSSPCRELYTWAAPPGPGHLL